jgi:hypothetical protein
MRFVFDVFAYTMCEIELIVDELGRVAKWLKHVRQCQKHFLHWPE